MRVEVILFLFRIFIIIVPFVVRIFIMISAPLAASAGGAHDGANAPCHRNLLSQHLYRDGEAPSAAVAAVGLDAVDFGQQMCEQFVPRHCGAAVGVDGAEEGQQKACEFGAACDAALCLFNSVVVRIPIAISVVAIWEEGKGVVVVVVVVVVVIVGGGWAPRLAAAGVTVGRILLLSRGWAPREGAVTGAGLRSWGCSRRGGGGAASRLATCHRCC